MRLLKFSELPLHDTIWSITTGPDGNIYVGICGELTDGLSAFIARYKPVEDELEYLLEVAPALNEPVDNGRAPVCKVHNSMIPGSDGKLYCATHYSGAPVNDGLWRPWHTWDDPERMAAGFNIFTYDLASGALENYGVMSPNEGCRTMAFAENRGLLYGLTWPRNHFFVFDLKNRKYSDIGRIGEINPQSVWLDKDENGYTVDDFGSVIKYIADENKLCWLDAKVPQDPDISSEERSVYDAIPSPDGKSIYGITWNLERVQLSERLFRFNMEDCTVDDLGPACGEDKLDHVGGLVFGDDGYLYFACSRNDENRRLPYRMFLFRMNVETMQKEEIGPVDDGSYHSEYIGKASKDFAGNLYFADTNSRPCKIYTYTPEGSAKNFTPRWPMGKRWG